MEQKINTTVDDDDDNYDGNRSKKKDIKSMQKHAEAAAASRWVKVTNAAQIIRGME